MIIGPRRVVLIGAIAAIALTIIFYPLLVATPFSPDDITIRLGNVELASGSEGRQSLTLQVEFNLVNTSPYALTTSRIDYELYADGVSLGDTTLSYEDIPVNGRPALFSNSPITLPHQFELRYADDQAELFNRILNNSGEISWSVTGMARIESGTSYQELTFSDEL